MLWRLNLFIELVLIELSNISKVIEVMVDTILIL